MWLPFLLFAVTVLGCFAAIVVGMSVSHSMQFDDYLKVMLVFSPLVLVGVLASRRYWIGITLGLLPFTLVIPVTVLNRFQIGMAFAGLVYALVLGGVCFRQYSTPVVRDWGAILFLLGGALCIGRVLYDRPTSAMLGGGEGGGGQAVVFCLAFLVFWAFSKVASVNDWNPLKVMGITFLLAGAALAQRLLGSGRQASAASGDVDATAGLLSNIYARPGWFVFGIALAWVIYKYGYKKSQFLLNQALILGSGLILALAALSGHRSRPLFAVGSIMMVCYVYREHKKAFFLLSFAVFLGLLGLIGTGMENVSPKVRRALSIVIPVSQEEATKFSMQKQAGGEVGWESDFRSGLYAIAWEKIQGNPVFGAGFTFSAKDLITLLNTVGDKTLSRAQVGLATVGGYHNSYLQLAVGAGLPSGIFALMGTILIIWKFMQHAQALVDPVHSFFAAALLGILIPLMGQVLMNGDSADFSRAAVILGVMNGVRFNPAFRRVGDPEPPPPEATHKAPQLAEGDIPAGFGGPLKW